jgi:hypothetical protein
MYKECINEQVRWEFLGVALRCVELSVHVA